MANNLTAGENDTTSEIFETALNDTTVLDVREKDSNGTRSVVNIPGTRSFVDVSGMRLLVDVPGTRSFVDVSPLFASCEISKLAFALECFFIESFHFSY
jgi:hypothetical protein